MTIGNDKVVEFLNSVLALTSIDFPAVAKSVGINWFELKDAFITNAVYMHSFDNAMEELRYKLLDKILLVGRDGKKGMGKDAELSYLKAIIQLIDEGLLVKKAKEEKKDVPVEPDPALVEEHRRRLGLTIEGDK